MSDTAYWIGKRMDKSHYYYFCSACNNRSRFKKSLFCPVCGRRMLEKENIR